MERISPEIIQNQPDMELILLTHLKSYALTEEFTRDKTVLDLGCGEGYGSQVMARWAREIVACDVSEESIQFAKRKYPHSNIEFVFMESSDNLPQNLTANPFDAVVSFQVIEHIHDDNAFIRQVAGLLKPEGIFFLTTPNASVRLLPFQNPWNQFHIREYNFCQLKKLLTPYFDEVQIFGMGASHRLLEKEEHRVRRNQWLLWPLTHALVPLNLRTTLLKTAKDVLKSLPGHAALDSAAVPAKPEDPIPRTDEIYLTRSLVTKCHNFFAVCYNNLPHRSSPLTGSDLEKSIDTQCP